MSEWRLRDPGSFSLEFHNAMQAGLGVDKVVSARWTKAQCEVDQVQWRIFRFSLRHYTAHPSSSFEFAYVHRTRIAYNRQKQRWELLLTSRKKVLEDMRIAS